MINRIRHAARPSWEVQVIWRGSPHMLRGYLLLTALSTALGIVVTCSDPARFSGPGFRFVQFTGGHNVWGVLFLIAAGALALAPQFSAVTMRYALRAAATIYMLFAVGFGAAAINFPTAGLTGPIAYAVIAALHVSQAETYRVPRLQKILATVTAADVGRGSTGGAR